MQQPTKTEVRWEWIGEGWQMFAERWGVWVLHALIPLLATLAIIIPFSVVIFIEAIRQGVQQSQEPPLAIFLLYPALIGFLLLVGPFFAAGGYHTALKQLRGETIRVADLFGGIRYYPRMLVLTFLTGIATSIGCAMFVVPAFILGGMWLFAPLLVVERGLGPIEALGESFRVTRANLLMFILFAFVMGLLAMAGGWACWVGMLVTYPLWFTTLVVAYRDCFGVAGARRFSQTAPPPPPNYNPSYGQGYGAPPNYPPQLPQTPPQTYGTVTCPHCQSTVSANAAFCPRCGGSVRG